MTQIADSSIDQSEAKQEQEKEWTTLGMLKVCGAVFVILTAIFVPFPEIDLWVAALFYNGENDFWLRQSLLTYIKNDYLRPAVGVIAVSGLVYYIYHRLTGRPSKVKKLARYGFLLVCIALSTGFVVHTIFKENFGRARPKQVIEFAGDRQFTPALLPAQQCARNCSFVSGDASAGYVFLALALYAAKRRKFWICTTLAIGFGLGVLRLMNGAHFLSDILYAGVFTSGTVLLLYRWMVEGKGSKDLGWIGHWAVSFGRWVYSMMPQSAVYRLLRARVRIRKLARHLS